MAKNFNDISNNHIDNEKLKWLELHILGVDYLEESLSYYTKILIEDNNKVEADTKKLESISNFKKKKKIKKKSIEKLEKYLAY